MEVDEQRNATAPIFSEASPVWFSVQLTGLEVAGRFGGDFGTTFWDYAAIALAFDAFFAEVRWQIATGRLPYRISLEHTWVEKFNGGFYCAMCRHGIYDRAAPCRAFYPRIM